MYPSAICPFGASCTFVKQLHMDTGVLKGLYLAKQRLLWRSVSQQTVRHVSTAGIGSCATSLSRVPAVRVPVLCFSLRLPDHEDDDSEASVPDFLTSRRERPAVVRGFGCAG